MHAPELQLTLQSGQMVERLSRCLGPFHLYVEIHTAPASNTLVKI